MKVLLICPKFHGYEDVILNELNKKGYSVDSFFYEEEQIFRLNAFHRILISILSKSLKVFSDRAFYKVLCHLQLENNDKLYNTLKRLDFNSKEYERLLVVKGYGIPPKLLESINAKKKVLYQWDSLLFYPNLSNIYGYFDYVFTFDENDSKNGFGEYLPNFYQKYKNDGIENIKLFYIGKYTRERLLILEKMVSHCNNCGITHDVELIYSGANKKILTSPLVSKNVVSRKDYRARFSSASIILELSNRGQVGSTQRLYEALGNNKIVITENRTKYSISYEDFFSMNIEELSNYNRTTPPFINDYEVGNWLERLLGK
ncbi:hypothetical protein E1100_16770 [Vibrio owensii]|uniref:hypothetical protein n=1 Tax=Vibrio owensii TaxID=696485 RepID=UPI001048DE7D|nr:hypothetical protein [Vibrio owensii]TDE21638.1 hypothetical protein E1100_16770 [Vibrio owensii]